MWGVDILEVKESYVLVCIDYFQRFAMECLIRDKKSTTISGKMREWYEEFGNPQCIVIDHGGEFNNDQFKQMCIDRQIECHMVAIEHHKSAGRIERFNRTLREAIRKSNQVVIDPLLINNLVGKYNNTRHSAIQITPMEAWSGIEPKKLCNLNSNKSAYAGI